ncbi:MAG: hypothetical protein DWP97_11600 [Calditrichaeota bacterium]|nr:MAG: hypothetical protein DWP97_11600 [Calditrichota bacterium]
MLHRIVITGAPASGKTLFFERLKNDRDFSGFIFFEELARQLLEENPDYRNNWPLLHRVIYKKQVEREDKSAGQSFVSDRGTIDAFAFHPETVTDVNTTIDKEYSRYTDIILLESSARLGGAFYKKDKIRLESISDTIFIEEKLLSVWSDHPNFHIIKAQSSIEQKYSEFYQYIKSIISKSKI